MSPKPVAIYVHWPYCDRICPYCDFNVRRFRGQDAQPLLDAIIRDLMAHRDRLGRRQATSLYFGGGTPSLLQPSDLERVIDCALELFPPSPHIEITLEANPTDAEADKFRDFAAVGVQRLSLGVQSFDPRGLKLLGRNHDCDQVARAIERAQSAFARASVDLIHSWAGQSLEDWEAEIKRAASFGVEHLSLYQLTIEQGTAFDRRSKRGEALSAEPARQSDLLEAGFLIAARAGYECYEVSNFAKSPQARSRHNLTYWAYGDWIGVGPGAHGRFEGPDRDKWATMSAPDLKAYIQRVGEFGCGWESAEALAPHDRVSEQILFGMRSILGVEAALCNPRAALELLDLGLIERAGDRIRATHAGRLVLNRVTLELQPKAVIAS